MTVFEHLGGPARRSSTARPRNGASARAPTSIRSPSNASPAPGARRLLAPAPGLPDDAFEHDGQLTKREVRAVTLARLAPLPGQMLWDVGAGCGSIAIEWLRAAASGARDRGRTRRRRRARDRSRAIAARARRPGVAQLVVGPRRREALAGLPPPDAIFIGGGIAGPACSALLGGAAGRRPARRQRRQHGGRAARSTRRGTAANSPHRGLPGREPSARSSCLAAADGGHAVCRGEAGLTRNRAVYTGSASGRAIPN